MMEAMKGLCILNAGTKQKDLGLNKVNLGVDFLTAIKNCYVLENEWEEDEK